MSKRIEHPAPMPRRILIVDARRRIDVLPHAAGQFLWRTRRPLISRILSLTLSTILIAGIARDARAAFEGSAISARAAAMGGAALTGEGDSASMFLNPAAGAALKDAEMYLMYSLLYSGLSGIGAISRGLGAVAAPTRYGTVGIGFSEFKAAGLLQERAIGLTFSRRYRQSLDIGVTAKFLDRRHLTGSDPLAAADPIFRGGASRSAPGFDAGIIGSVTRALSIGLALRNINNPDLGLAAEDRVPREIQASIAYELEAWSLRVTADYTHRALNSGSLGERGQPAIALEKTLEGNRVKLRLGATLQQLGGGVGFELGRLGIDYAFILTHGLVSDNAGAHQIGIRYRFGGNKQ